jgi:hypothetical protein
MKKRQIIMKKTNFISQQGKPAFMEYLSLQGGRFKEPE